MCDIRSRIRNISAHLRQNALMISSSIVLLLLRLLLRLLRWLWWL